MIPMVQAQDWANLERYKTENSLLSKPKANEHRVIFMGNSITEGWSGVFPNFFTDNTYVNRGVSGQTTPQMLLRFRQDVIALQPKAVVILAGTNDIAGNTGPMTLQMIMDNLISMVELANANAIKVILCSVLPAFDYPWRPGLSPNTKIPALNQLMESYANTHDIIYLNYFDAMTDGNNGMQAELTTDGVHVSKKGYELMIALVQEAIAKTRTP